MNLTPTHTFHDGVIRQYMYEYVVFDVFLTGKPFFRRTDPALASAAIAFSPLHAAFPTAIPSHAFLPERRQNAADCRTGYIYTDPCPRSPSSARRIPASPAFSAPASAGLHTPGAAAIPVCGWPESRSSAPSCILKTIYNSYVWIWQGVCSPIPSGVLSPFLSKRRIR